MEVWPSGPSVMPLWGDRARPCTGCGQSREGPASRRPFARSELTQAASDRRMRHERRRLRRAASSARSSVSRPDTTRLPRARYRSYVSPAVIEQWRDGRTLERYRARRRRVVSGRDTEHLAEESALLSLLRSWRIRRSLAA